LFFHHDEKRARFTLDAWIIIDMSTIRKRIRRYRRHFYIFIFKFKIAFFLFKFISFEFDFTSICKALILRNICDEHATHSSRKIIRYANRLRNKINKKIINLVLRVENEAFVFFNLNARCEWTHTRLKNTNNSTINRIFRHQTRDVDFKRQCRVLKKAKHLYK
jgi:hypothetical protein